MTLTRRQFLAGTVALPFIGSAFTPAEPTLWPRLDWDVSVYDWAEYGHSITLDPSIHRGDALPYLARMTGDDARKRREQLAVNVFGGGFDA